MANQAEIAKGLEDASQKHEKEIVIDFASDRILHYIGVYLIAFLAVIAKISELAGTNLSCYPFGNTSMRADFIKYATSYCWETSDVTNSEKDVESTCANFTVSGRTLLENPSLFKGLIQWIPYVMLLEALLFSIPSVCWHYTVGARLMGHLKFMQQILGDIYDKVKGLKTACYRRGESYDRESYYLNGWHGFLPTYWNSQDNGRENEDEESNTNTRHGICLRVLGGKCSGDPDPESSESDVNRPLKQDSSHANPSSQGESESRNYCTEESGFFDKLLFGEMRDRHLFSMLCFENFSNLEQIPYILSMYTLTKSDETGKEDGAGTFSRIKGILRLICHKDTFRGRFLVKRYMLKHMFGFFVAFAALSTTAIILYTLGADGWNAENFRCDMVYHMNVCMVCTIRRKRDMIAYLAVNLLVNAVYLVLSFAKLVRIRSSPDKKSTSHYFEEISVYGSVALDDYDDEEEGEPDVDDETTRVDKPTQVNFKTSAATI